MAKTLTKLKHYYDYYERRISVASLVAGFIFDSLTLQRVDNLLDNLWITGNLLLSALVIVFLNRRKEGNEGFWLPNILQFSFGALLGSIFVFYLRSTALMVTWPFLALVLFALIANEFFQKRYTRLALRLSFLYFALFSFSIFLMPIATGSLGAWVFLLSGAVSLLVIWLFLKLVRRFAREQFLEQRTHVWSFIGVIFFVVNLLYFTNLIPPIPLSLKDGGIYHAIEIDSRGRYLATGEKRGVERYFTLFPEVYWQPGQPLYAYSAIYSPGSIETNIVHDWQYKNEAGEWITATRIPLHLEGGRVEGFRTFSEKFTFSPGLWRVDVKTNRGQVIGRLNFEVITTGPQPPIATEVKG